MQTDNGKPTRTQRIKYAIQGGITDQILENLGFDTNELNDEIKIIKNTINDLSKYTHINKETFNLTDDEIKKNSELVLNSFKKFAEKIESYRVQLKNFLDGIIDEQMIDGVLANYYENVDLIASRHYVNYSEIYEYKIVEITHNSIIVEVFGSVHFTLEYGSKEDGLELYNAFPFQTKIIYKIDDDFPSSDYEIEEFDVDTREWYGDENVDE